MYIKAISYYLPCNVLTNAELVKAFPEWDVEKVVSKIGINQRHIAGTNETSVDMAVKAAEKVFKESGIDRKDIDFILFCTQSPDYLLPTSACLIQEKLGLSTSCGALDFNLGCSGYVYGLSLAKGLIVANIAQNVLLLTSESYSKYLHPKDKSNRAIFGDAASATILSTTGVAEILNFSLGTDGRGAENLILKTGGQRYPKLSNECVISDDGNLKPSDYLYMNGSEIFNFTLDSVPDMVFNAMQKNGLTKTDVDLFVFHQANKYMLNYLRKKMKIDEDRFYYFMEEVGNTVSSTIPIALVEAAKENRLHGNVLIAGFGVGYSWGGTILKYS